jgi:hypothetical protein
MNEQGEGKVYKTLKMPKLIISFKKCPKACLIVDSLSKYYFFKMLEKLLKSLISMFFWSMFKCSQSGDHPKEDLVKFGYKLNLNFLKKTHPSIFLDTYLEHV